MKFGREDYNGRIVDKDGLIPDDEPCFILRAKDVCAPKAIMAWISEYMMKGGDSKLATNALSTVQEMLEWQKANGCKLPDSSKSPQIKFIKDQLNILIDKINRGEAVPIDQLESWLSKLYGNKPDLLIILMKSDLKESSKLKSPESLIFDDFNLSTEDVSKCYEAKLILYVTTTRNYILGNKIDE